MAREIEDGAPIDDFNVGYNWIHEEDCNEDDDYEYIKSTVTVDFLPYIGKLVQQWPTICAKSTLEKWAPPLSLSSQ